MFEKYLDFVDDEFNRISMIYEGILGQGIGSAVGTAIAGATGTNMTAGGAIGGAVGGAVTAKKGERLKDAAIGGAIGGAVGFGADKFIGKTSGSSPSVDSEMLKGGPTKENAAKLAKADQEAQLKLTGGETDPNRPFKTGTSAGAEFVDSFNPMNAKYNDGTHIIQQNSTSPIQSPSTQQQSTTPNDFKPSGDTTGFTGYDDSSKPLDNYDNDSTEVEQTNDDKLASGMTQREIDRESARNALEDGSLDDEISRTQSEYNAAVDQQVADKHRNWGKTSYGSNPDIKAKVEQTKSAFDQAQQNKQDAQKALGSRTSLIFVK